MSYNLETVAVFDTPLEAHIAKGRLVHEGLTAFLADEHIVSANWMMLHAVGGIKLQVLAKDVPQAKLILDQHEKGEFAPALQDSFDTTLLLKCPTCQSTKIQHDITHKSKLWMIVNFLFFGIVYRLRKNIHKCSQCGSEWQS